jgi:hypothetical protein
MLFPSELGFVALLMSSFICLQPHSAVTERSSDTLRSSESLQLYIDSAVTVDWIDEHLNAGWLRPHKGSAVTKSRG